MVHGIGTGQVWLDNWSSEDGTACVTDNYYNHSIITIKSFRPLLKFISCFLDAVTKSINVYKFRVRSVLIPTATTLSHDSLTNTLHSFIPGLS